MKVSITGPSPCFNHQTHHRGLLSQAGVDIGVTDLLAQIPEEAGD